MLKKIFGNLFEAKAIRHWEKKAAAIGALENNITKLSLDELRARSEALKQKARDGKELDALTEEAFALVREASRRTLKQRHFDTQLVGGLVLHEGKIAEMFTGEGKTLAATLPAYLNGLAGRGVHVVTVNEYLAKRDTVWMGQIYHALGLRVACLTHEGALEYDPHYENEPEADKERDTIGGFLVVDKFLRPITRKEAYLCDITYGTNHEFGFDFLRDNLVLRLSDRVQREHFYAIIDEVDSILIDEARTPLIIAAPDSASSAYYKTFAGITARLNPETDYETDEKLKVVNITEPGIEKVEKMLGINNIFSPEYARLVHYLQESLRARALFYRDRDYVVKNNEIIIVDEFTGRMLPGRRYSHGLHQAIEAKEGVLVREENRTFAQITIQNYFRLYRKIAGMTGTAATSAEEFHKVYNLSVVSIPTNRPLARKNLPDLVYKTKEAKYQAVVEEIKKLRAAGRPALIGTTSITNNEIIADYLKRANVPHEILNAKNNEREGAIIAQAGRPGAVTVATNMAGRGVDIILGGNPPVQEDAEKVKTAGGLAVIGTERHEARRIDNQLRGRSGRQGDPGSGQFFLSLEDDLLRIFGGDRIKRLMQTFNFPEDMPIESGLITKSLNQAQMKVEGNNFDARRHLLDFDDVLNKQRSAVYLRRLEYLSAGEEGRILEVVAPILQNFAAKSAAVLEQNQEISREEKEAKIKEADNKIKEIPTTVDKLKSAMLGQHLVRILDTLWVENLEQLENLRESVNIRAYAQHEPLTEYRREAHELFKSLENNFEHLLWNSVFSIFSLDINEARQAAEKEAIKKAMPHGKEPGRNDPCPCGSGKKYKKCHGT